MAAEASAGLGRLPGAERRGGADEAAPTTPEVDETAPASDPPGPRRPRRRRPRRRPGRFRRLVLRPLLWGLAAIALLVFVAQLLIDTRWARSLASELIAERLGAYLEREVTIEEISFELLPLTVTVRGFRIAGPDPEETPFAYVPYATIDAELDALKQRRIHLRRVRVERPRVYIHFFPDGTHNVIKIKPKKRRERRFEVYIDRFEVDRAEFHLDHDRVRLSVSADAVQTRMQGLGELLLGGQTVAQNVIVRLPNAESALPVAVAARGTFGRGRVEVESARVTGQGLSALADGSCEWVAGEPRQRKCLIQARGEGRGAVLEELGYFRDLEGEFGFAGTLAWRPGTTGWRSRVDAERLVLWERPVTGVSGSVVADRYGVRLGLDEARYAGGEVGGDVIYEHTAPGRPMSLDLDFRGLVLDTLLADQQIPTQGTASRIDGTLRYRFPLSQSRRGDGRAEVRLRGDPSLPGLPLAGAFPLRLENGVVRSESIAARSERQSVLARGAYDLETSSGEFEYEVASADLAEIAPLLPLSPEAREEPPLWLPSAGQGEFSGTLYLEPGSASTDLRLDLEGVETSSLAARRVRGGMRLDRLAAEDLHLELGDESEALMMRGRVAFLPEDPAGTDLVFDAFDWPLDTARPWLEFELPVDGRVSGRFDLRASGGTSVGRLAATVAPAVLTLPVGAAAEPLVLELESFATRLSWDPEGMIFDRLELAAAGGVVEGEGTYEWESERYDLAFRSAALALGREPLSAYLPRPDLRGEVSASARFRGTLAEPEIDLRVEAERLALGPRRLEGPPSSLVARWSEGELEARGRLLDWLEIEGGGRLDGRRADVDLRLASARLGALAELVAAELPADFDGSFRGRLRLVGDTAGGLPPAELELASLRLELGGRALENLDPVVARLGPEHLLVDSLRLGEEASGSRFALSGRAGYERAAPLDLRLESTMATSWLELLDLDLDLDGRFELDGRVGGTLAEPALDGRGELRDARLAFAGFPYPLENLNGGVRLEPRSLVIENVEGRLAGGRVTLAGRVDLGGLEEPWSYRLRVSGEELRLLYPEGWSLRGDAELTVQTAEEGHLVSGRAELDRIEYLEDVRFDFAELMRTFLRRQRLEVAPADGLLSEIALNVEIEGPEALQVRNNLADLRGDVDLVLRGNLARPVLYGEVDVEPGGTVVYNSTEYDVERGRVVFADPYRLDPEIDLVASTRVRDFDVTLAVEGTFARLSTSFSSEPPLPDLEVFRLLATGDETPQSIELEPRLARRDEDRSTSAASFLYGQAAAVIGERFNTLFGLDKFRIDPLTGSGDSLSTARVTVGKRLSRDVFVTYSIDPSSTEEQRLRVEWQISPSLALVLSQNGDNTYSADARWETSF